MAERFVPVNNKRLRLSNVTVQVQMYTDRRAVAWRMWKLIPVDVESAPRETVDPDDPPSYDVTWEYEGDEFGTVVTEVTTITSRTKYRLWDV